MTAPLVHIRDLRYRYPGAAGDALDGLDLDLEQGAFLAVVGPNGCGKSTLARLLGGLERPRWAVAALVCGHDLLDDAGRHAARRDAGVLFQDPENQLVAENVEEDVAFGLENLAWPTSRMAARVDEVLRQFGLWDLRHRAPHLLSGGQAQRAALAGVLAVPRRLVVLDEPTAMLDSAGRHEVMQEVHRLRAEGMSVVLITQEMEDVPAADTVLAMHEGRAAFLGAPRELFARHDLVRSLGLGLPPAGEVAVELTTRGRVLSGTPLDLDELVAMIAGTCP